MKDQNYNSYNDDYPSDNKITIKIDTSTSHYQSSAPIIQAAVPPPMARPVVPMYAPQAYIPPPIPMGNNVRIIYQPSPQAPIAVPLQPQIIIRQAPLQEISPHNYNTVPVKNVQPSYRHDEEEERKVQNQDSDDCSDCCDCCLDVFKVICTIICCLMTLGLYIGFSAQAHSS